MAQPAANFPTGMDLSALAADGFGYWLAGFMDGEAHFRIHSRRDPRCIDGLTHYGCEVTIELRDDDDAILETCRERTGLGRLTFRTRDHGPINGNPQVTWRIGTRDDVLKLVRLLDRFPLRAKKAKDYAIWREAVLEWHRTPSGRRGSPADRSRMADLKSALEAVRRYRNPDVSDAAPLITRADSQLRLVALSEETI